MNDQILHLHYYEAPPPAPRQLPPARRRPTGAQDFLGNFARGYLLGLAVFGSLAIVGLLWFIVVCFLYA